MNNTNTYLTNCFLALILIACSFSAQAQTQTAPSYKDLVVENSTAFIEIF